MISLNIKDNYILGMIFSVLGAPAQPIGVNDLVVLHDGFVVAERDDGAAADW